MLPKYAREYEKEFQRYDRMLRLVRSIDTAPGCYLLERKTRYLSFPDMERGTDRARRYNSGFRLVMVVAPNELPYVRRSLERTDIQRRGGAKVVADEMDTEEARISELADRAMRSEFDAIGSEMYDRLAWAEGRRVSMGGHGG